MERHAHRGAGMKRRLARLPLLTLALLVILTVVLLPATAWAQTSTIDGDVGDIDSALDYPTQTKSFYASGLHWFFWVDTDDDLGRFSASADLSAGSWAAATDLRDSTIGRQLAVFYDEVNNKVHVAQEDKSDADVWYRMGTPESDGSITWAAAWDDVEINATSPETVNITVDSNGYPFVSVGGTVYRSTTKDGIFTSDGAPHSFAGVSYPVLVPLTNGKVLAGRVAAADNNLDVTRWDGFNWSAEVEYDDANDINFGYTLDARNVDDDVYFLFKLEVGAEKHTAMVKYTYSTNSFGSSFSIYAHNTGELNQPCLTKDTNDDLYVLWPNYNDPDSGTDEIYYRLYDVSAGTLGDIVVFVDESVLDGLPANCRAINADYDSQGFLKVYYPAGAARAKVKGESLLQVTTLDAAAITETTARLRGEITMLGLASASDVGVQYQLCDSGSATTVSDSGAFGLGVFNFDVEGLDADECYEYRAYAIDASGTTYGDWVGFLTAQPDYASTEQDAAGSESFLPDVPEQPEGFYPETGTDPTFSGLPGADLFNSLSESADLPVAFWWYLILAIGFTLVGLLIYGGTKEQLAVAAIAAAGLGFLASLDWIGWWMLACYVIVALGLKGVEKNYGL